MKEYRVKVTEKHCDYVWVKANSEYEATRKAPRLAKCKFDVLYDSEVVEERDIQHSEN